MKGYSLHMAWVHGEDISNILTFCFMKNSLSPISDFIVKRRDNLASCLSVCAVVSSRSFMRNEYSASSSTTAHCAHSIELNLTSEFIIRIATFLGRDTFTLLSLTMLCIDVFVSSEQCKVAKFCTEKHYFQ